MTESNLLANALVTADRMDDRAKVMRDTDSAVMMNKAAKTIRELVALAQPAVVVEDELDSEVGWSKGWKS